MMMTTTTTTTTMMILMMMMMMMMMMMILARLKPEPLQAQVTWQQTSSYSSLLSLCRSALESISFSTPTDAGRRCDQPRKVCTR
jgi:hypothetical protein